MSSLAVGSLVWFDGNVGFLLPGKLLSFVGSQDVKVQHEMDGQLQVVRANAVYPRQEISIHGVDDMIKMDDLHVGSILYNIRKRYRQDQIYTYIGSILVAVNPYMQYDIYGPDVVQKYYTTSIKSQPPHIFAIGNAAYQTMLRTEHKQAIIISGESGAGKTESSRLLVEFLAAVSQTDGSPVTKQIVEATPLLESFGNARTVKNDNSSRFGKYLEIFYDSQGKIAGGRISEYLLERSRIVGQANGERNYHIFYEMLRGLPEEQKEKLNLTTAKDFAYLNQGKASVIPNRKEEVYFQHVIKAMDVLGIPENEKESIFKVLALILHLGNVDFGKSEAGGQEAAVIMGQTEVMLVSQFLGLGVEDLVVCLTHKETEAGGSKVRSPRSINQAVDARDALAKEIYSRLFGWLISKVNDIVYSGKRQQSIAVLDIFGFEDFERNSFEQLCINFANETLQFFFNQFVFRMEQDEYSNEHIRWTKIPFFDNQPRLDLLAKPPHGLIHILADATGFPRADDLSFLEKCHHHHEQNKFYEKPKMPKPEFAISHFAGTVWYQVTGFLEKNRDGLKPDLEDLISSCRNKFIHELFPELKNEELSIQGLKLPSQHKNSLRLPLNQKKKPTVCGKFNDSLIKLVVAMKSCNPFFVRCIKPNSTKVAGKFEIPLVVEQLKYSGIVETVKIRKAGYPVRFVYAEFIKRYSCLSSHLDLSSTNPRENTSRILKLVQFEPESFQFGKSKVFLKEDLHCSLEDARMAKLNRMAVVIQARMRGYYVNSKYLKMKKAAIVIQSNTRRFLDRKKFLKARKGFILLQAVYRMKQQRRTFMKLQNESHQKARPQKQAVLAASVPPSEETVEVKDAPEVVEIEKQIVTDVTHLEIPADLALVFANLQGWSLANGSSVQERRGEVIKHDYTVSKLPDDINDFPFSKFVQEHFQSEHQWRMLRAPLRNSLLPIKYSDSVMAIGLFQLVMRFMDDESITGAKEFAVGNYLVQMGIFKPELREEMYCHLCNQTWGNNSDTSNGRGWLLLALFLCCLPPSSRLYKHLLKYVSDQAFNGYKSYCQHKMLCWDMSGSAVARSHPPTLLEWQAAKMRTNMAAECHFPDGERRTAEVESSTTGEELASLILKDRGIEDPKGWSVDLESNDFHCSLAGKDYVLDLISELEYPPAFPLSRSSSLLTVKPGHTVPESQLNTLSNLHMPQARGKSVAEIAHRFSFVDNQSSSSSSHVQREDALSAATSARLASVSSQGPHEDNLVQRARLGSSSAHVESVSHPSPFPQVFVPPPPPPPPEFVPPPPPPPPPVVPPTERVILRRKTTKKDKDRKKRDSGGPQLSMAEVIAKAKKMREQRERVLSSGSGPTSGTQDASEDPFESAMQARVVQLKSRRVEVQQGPKQEEDSELMKEMRRKAQRASRAFVENEKTTHLGVEDGVLVADSERRFSRDNSSCSSREAGDNDSLQSIESTERLESPKQVKDFVDSLFDPVLSQGVEGLSDEVALQGALKGGGGVNQPNTPAASASTASVSTAVNGHPAAQPHAQGNGYPVNPTGQVQGNGYPGMVPAGGFPGVMPGASMYYGMPQVNGPLVGLPQASLYPGNMDAAMLAAQQQVIIERLIAQQAMLQQQQTVASQKQQEQLLLLAQQQQAQLEQMQQILAASGHPAPQQLESHAAGHPAAQEAHASEASSSVTINTATNGHVASHNGETTIQVLSPPTEFSDVNHSPPQSPIPPPPSPLVLIPPRSTSLPPAGATIQIQQVSSGAETFPPPPPPIAEDSSAVESVSTPQRPGLTRRATDKIALAVAAIEAKADEPCSPSPSSPLKHGDSFTFSVSSPTRKESVGVKERPGIHKRTSSALNFVVLSDKQTSTVLHPKSAGPHLSYSQAKWRLNIRKEVFAADEKKVTNNLVQRLIFLQILRDSYSNCCCKMSKEDCKRMQLLLQKYGITPERPHSSIPVEDVIIEAARQLPLYFSRFFVVKGQNEMPDVHYMAVSEHGVKLVKREKITDELEVVKNIPYTELVKLKAAKDKLTLTLTKEVKVVFNTDRAFEAKQIIDTYLRNLEKEVKYVRALYDHVSPEPSLLNFKKGDVVKIVPKDDLEEGWVYGVFNNHGGYFPADYVTHIQEDPQAVPAVRPSNLVKAASVGSLLNLDTDGPMTGDSRVRSGSVKSTKSDNSQYHHSDKHSMMEFAMQYFRFGREALVRGEDGTIRGTVKVRGTLGRSSKASHKKDKAEWTWKGLAELVKYSRIPIQTSLVRLDTTQLNKLAVETFQMIMKFMGDLPMSKHQKETEIVFSLLKTCREIPDLRDEVYCQLIKQVTSNKSQKAESASRGWRLLIIITAYIECSDVFKPYLVTFLQSTASDPKREFHGAAATCEMNLMKTFKYGGRKTPPSKEELNQLVQGRQTKRQVFVLPGGTRMLKVQTSSTGYDVIKEMCGDMDLSSESHYKEYGLFTFMEGQNVMVPVQTTDYIMDVVSSMERQGYAFSLCFRRVLWLQGLRLDNELLVSVIYHQVLPDYMVGYLLATHGRSFGDAQFQNQIAELGALQYRARDRSTLPANHSEVESLIPRAMLDKLRPQQWMMLIQDHFRSCHTLSPHQARRKFLETVTKWPYFGSTFFEVKKCSHPSVSGDCILAVNRTGVHFLNHTTMQTLLSEPFMSIISTRLLISDKKRQFLDLKIGNAMMQKVTRMETTQAKEISNLIYKYVAVHSSAKQEGQGLAGVVVRSQQESQRM